MTNKKFYSIFIFLFASVILIMGIGYISWRFFNTLNLFTSPFSSFWSYTLLGAEILTLIVFTNFTMILLKSSHLKKIKPDNVLQNDYYKDVFHNGELVTFKNYCPSVDIFICTLNEPADLLSATISACKNIDYPNFKVYVLDDGRRTEIKELAELLECNYITRTTNKGFKAGNINNALDLTDSEIVVIFDSDHIPASTFLRETVYNFLQEDVALVQTPQHFCNPDAFQKNLEMQTFLSNEQDIFYRIIEPSLNEFDSVFCGGTNILIRRKHLESVGNFPENTITEDSLLGLMFHSAGYRVVYYNRPIAIGLSASSFEEYIKQRARWAKGNVQIIMNPSNWKYYARLTPKQAFFYLSGILYFFTPIARLIYLSAPVLFLLSDISPIFVLFYQIFAFQICYFGLKFIFLFSAKIRVNNVILADVYDLVTSIFTIGGILQAMFLHGKLSKIKFSVTKKDNVNSKTSYRYKAPLVVIFIILIIAEMQGIYDILYSEPYSVLAIVANLFWNFTNIVVMYFAIRVVSEKPEKRIYQRVKVADKLLLQDGLINKIEVETSDISRSGVSFIAAKDLTDKNLKLDIEGENNEIKIIGCKSENNGKFLCKSKFRLPIVLFKLTKKRIKRLNKYIKFAYKNPDQWDNFFKGKDE